MPDGPTYAYTYDDNDRLTHLTIPGVGDITYPSYTLNRPDSVTFPGGSNQSYTYDALMRLEQIVSSPSGMDYQYTSYDGVSNILTKSTEHGNYVYDYDDMYRLTDVDNPTLDDEVYTYDGVGNRLTSADVIGNWSYNQNNELLGYADVEYTYDENGNMTQKRVGTAAVNYIYDAANRLVKVEDEASGTVIAEYFYDPFGRRLWKDVNGEKTYFLYADEGLVAEYDENDVKIRSYGYKPDSMGTTNPLFLKQGGQYYWYQNDHLGTPQKLIDINGTVVWSAQYTAFGEAVIDVETVTNNLRFPGQYEDAETGLYYNWFRYYEPGIGRYLRTDPIGLAGDDVNLYAYVWNDPAAWVDPFGLGRIAAATQGDRHGHSSLWLKRAKALKRDVTIAPWTGEEFLEELAKNSSKADPITELVILSHGWTGGVVMSPEEGFYSQKGLWTGILKFLGLRDAADIADLVEMIEDGDIVFSEDAVIKFLGCHIAEEDFAQRVADATKTTVIAAKGKSGPEKKLNKKGQEYETGAMLATGWYQHQPYTKPVKIGGNRYHPGR